MPTLSSLIVQREVATMRTVEEAIARQVLHGGDLATNLLETAAIPEPVLTGILAESHGLEPAPAGKLRAPSAAILRTIPGELALRHGIFPLDRDARTLVVATAEPLSPAVEEDFTFALDVGLKQLAAPLVRIRQAIAEHYGIPLDRRFLRLIARLEGRPDPSPSSLPPGGRGPGPIHLPKPATVPPATFQTGIIGRVPLVAGPVTRTPRVGPPEGPVIMPPIPRGGVPPTLLEGLTPVRLGDTIQDDPTIASAADEPVEVRAPPGPTVARSGDGSRVLAGWVKRAAVEDKKTRPSRPAGPSGAGGPPTAPDVAARSLGRGRRKGPYTASMAEEELLRCTTTDQLLDVFFAFSHQYFQYAVLFAVQGDLAEGRDASGPGADRARVSGIGVPLDLPSSLAVARDRRAPVVAPLGADGLDAELARDLGRVALGSAAVAVIPVVVKSRTVALLYGDDGTDGIDLSSIGDAISFTGLVATALERLILRKKLGGFRAADDVPERARLARKPARSPDSRGGADALARALGATPLPPPADVDHGPTRLVEPPRVSPGAASISPGAASVRPAVPLEQIFEDSISPVAESTRAPAARPPVEDAAALPVASEQNRDRRGAGPVTAAFDEQLAEEDSGESLNKAIVRAVEAPPPLPAEMRVGQVPDKSRPLTDAELGAGWGKAAPVGAASQHPPVTPAPTRPEGLRRGTLRGFGPPPPPGADAGRRAQAPAYEGRGRTPPAAPLGESLPRMPPPNATSIPSPVPSKPPADSVPPALVAFVEPPAEEPSPEPYPLAPPPVTAAAVRPLAHKPIPREEIEDDATVESPDASALVAAAEPSPSRPVVPAPAPSEESLPSVIVDVAAEYASLLERLLRGGAGSDEAFAELVKHGEHVLPTIVSRFPGPLRVDRHRARDLLPAASQCGPILELVVAMRRTALPFVTVRTSVPDPDVRFWATHVLGEMRYTEAANAVLPRLFDDEAAVRRIARRAAASLVAAGAAGQPILVGLDHLTRNADEGTPRRVTAIETMGEIRIGPMVPPLIAVLSDASDEVSDTARRALLLITRQDFARDQGRWTEWWTKNAGRHRVEWLIDALMHEVPSIRRAAGDELKQLTKEYFGYYDDLPKKERERAQGRYREWWEREGRSRTFG